MGDLEFQKDLIVWKLCMEHCCVNCIIIVSEGLNSVETCVNVFLILSVSEVSEGLNSVET